MVRESISTLNVTRLELMKNRANINQLIGSMANEVQAPNGFVQQYFPVHKIARP